MSENFWDRSISHKNNMPRAMIIAYSYGILSASLSVYLSISICPQ